MAGIRPGRCYTNVKRAYTRKSKYKKKSFIKAVPNLKIAKFDMGNPKRDYDCKLLMVSKENLQVRHNALESARVVIVRNLEKEKKPYYLKLRVYPHHTLRENKMLTGAGADRMQTGMQKAFGRAIGSAAQISEGQPIFSLQVDKQDKKYAVDALKAAVPRLPCKCSIITENKAK